MLRNNSGFDFALKGRGFLVSVVDPEECEDRAIREKNSRLFSYAVRKRFAFDPRAQWHILHFLHLLRGNPLFEEVNCIGVSSQFLAPAYPMMKFWTWPTPGHFASL